MNATFITIIAVAIFAVILILASYVKAPPSWAFIISGLNRKPRTYIGKGGFRIPGLERLDKVFLGQITADIKTNRSVPTNDFINVNVDAVAKIQVNNSPEGLQLAAKNFLNMSPEQISKQVQDSLEGNMRECVGAMSLRDININRDKFSDEIMSKAQKDMEALGLCIISCNIQNVTDDKNLIEDLGADNTWTIKKQAQINKANAQRDIAEAEAKARKEANDAQVDSDTQIAIRQNELAVKKSELNVIEQTKKAMADAAYAIQEQEQMLTINTKTVEADAAKQILSAEKKKEINAKLVEADTEKARREQELTAEQIKIKENKLRSEINKQAEAEKFQIETNAAAELERDKREAEAKAYKAEMEAKAQVALAEAKKKQMVLEAEGVKAQGEAEAYKIQCAGEAEAIAIEKKGLAEAEAMQKKAEAYEKYGQAAILDMMVKIIPEVSKNVAEPIGNIDNLNIYGTSGQDATGVSGMVPSVIKQSFDVIQSATGVDMGKMVQEKTNLVGAGVDIKK
jgi:flotillin